MISRFKELDTVSYYLLYNKHLDRPQLKGLGERADNTMNDIRKPSSTERNGCLTSMYSPGI